jgi:hypothetical protein
MGMQTLYQEHPSYQIYILVIKELLKHTPVVNTILAVHGISYAKADDGLKRRIREGYLQDHYLKDIVKPSQERTVPSQLRES